MHGEKREKTGKKTVAARQSAFSHAYSDSGSVAFERLAGFAFATPDRHRKAARPPDSKTAPQRLEILSKRQTLL